MKSSLPGIALALTSFVVACAAPTSGEGALANDVAAAEPEISSPGDDPAPAAVDFSDVPARIAENQSQGALAISHLATLMYSFAPPTARMDPGATAAANAALLAANVRAVKCEAATVAYEDGAAYLSVDFGDACRMTDTGLVASGRVQIGVTGDGANAAAAEIQVKGMTLAAYEISGVASMTHTRVAQTLGARVTAKGLGIVTFSGGVSAGGTSDAPAVILSGSGTFIGVRYSTPTNSKGIRCASSTESFLGFRKLRHATSLCFPEFGTLDVRTGYVCRPEGGAPDADFFTRATSSTVSFNGGSRTSGAVAITVAISDRSGADSAPAPTRVTLTSPACP